MSRDHLWLEDQLKLLLSKYFSDVNLSNPLEIRFGREAKYRFGSIKLLRDKESCRRPFDFAQGFGGQAKSQRDKGARGLKKISNFKFQISNLGKRKSIPQKSIITITSMFAKRAIPVKVVQYTISHELCHYVHGFSSTNRRLFKFPHHGGIVNKELTRRGAHDLITAYKKWLKTYRKKILASRVKA